MDYTWSQIKYTWFRLHFGICPVRSSEEVENSHARAYLFYLVANKFVPILPGQGGMDTFLSCLGRLKDMHGGPKCLTNMYKTLGKATRLKDRIRTLTGPLQLLQVIFVVCDHVIFMCHYVPPFID